MAGHGFIRSWSADGQEFRKAQKQPLSETSFRNAPSNTGWIGSHFVNSPAFVCGSSETPSDKVAPPSGTFFSSVEQSAKKTLHVKAGGKVSLIIAGNPGEGFPHHSGHISTYLGYCGKSKTACQNFDASKATYQRIQAEVDGISKKLIKQFSSEQDGDRWDVPIPKDIVDGSYILRLELLVFGQSSTKEGHQDQYYVFCGQIFVQAGTGSTPFSHSDDLRTVKFPGAYKAGNINPKFLPTLKNLLPSRISHPTSKVKAASKPTEAVDPRVKTDFKTRLSKCADCCYRKKLSELQHLAPGCSSDDLHCLCKSVEFVKAYLSCCNDHCQTLEETRVAAVEIYDQCEMSARSQAVSGTDDLQPVDPQSTAFEDTPDSVERTPNPNSPKPETIAESEHRC